LIVLLILACLILVFVSKNIGVRYSVFQHHQRWTSHAPEHYRYTLTISCFCAPEITEPFVVEVQNHIPIVAHYLNNGAPVTTTSLAGDQTIDGLFQEINDAANQRADSITVTYDETFGYPKEIRIDMNLFGRDDEIWYTITDFEVLN